MPEQTPHELGDAYRHARERSALFDLSPRGKVEAAGPDARSFLHNLCTNDIKSLEGYGAGCETFLCNVQARVIAHAFVTCLTQGDGPDTFLLDVEPGQDEKIVKHLDHYLISEQVEIANRTGALAHLHLTGPEAFAVLEHGLGELGVGPQELDRPVLAVEVPDVGHLRRNDALGVPGYDLICQRERAAEAWRLLTAAGAHPGGPEAYEVLRIEAGLPRYGVDIDESNLAPEVGRTAQAISYTKGCYLGQEPIVRIRDLGHVNRSLTGLRVAGAEPVPRGARLLRDGKEVGQVTSSAVSPRLGTVALAYVRRGHQDPGTAVEVETPAGSRAAAVASLPLSGGGAGAG